MGGCGVTSLFLAISILSCFGGSACTSVSLSAGNYVSQSSTACCYSLIDCFGSSLYQSSMGGALYVVSSTSSLSVSDCYFVNCSSGEGGCIYFNGTSFSTSGTCAKSCYGGAPFVCAISTTSQNVSQCSTYMCCPPDNDVAGDSTFLQYSVVTVNNFNATYNYVSGCAPSSNIYSATQSNAIYMVVVNCYAGSGGVVLFKKITSSVCTYSAIVNNSSPSTATVRGIIFSEAGCNCTFNNSVLIGNSAPYIFYQDSASTLFVGQCWINSTSGTITDAGVTIYMCSYGIGSTESISGVNCRLGLFSHSRLFTIPVSLSNCHSILVVILSFLLTRW